MFQILFLQNKASLEVFAYRRKYTQIHKNQYKLKYIRNMKKNLQKKNTKVQNSSSKHVLVSKMKF